jgi:SAM-dependent methyltransferase
MTPATLQQHRENHRLRTTARVFSKCPDKLFGCALEIGADYGFQSRLIARYISKLISSDITPYIATQQGDDTITYVYCDAQNQLEQMFAKKQFDFIFSSNVLEHLPLPDQAIKAMHQVLKDDGILIHLMPTRVFVTLQILLHVPHKIFSKMQSRSVDGEAQKPGAFVPVWLEPTTASQSQNKLRHKIRRLLLPDPHGVSKNLLAEMRVFGKDIWKQRFEKAGFDVVKIAPGPVPAMMKGLRLGPVQSFLERCQLPTEYVYISVKKGCHSPYLKHFV